MIAEHGLALLDAAVLRGIADAEAHYIEDAEAVLDRLELKYERMAADRGELG